MFRPQEDGTTHHNPLSIELPFCLFRCQIDDVVERRDQRCSNEPIKETQPKVTLVFRLLIPLLSPLNSKLLRQQQYTCDKQIYSGKKNIQCGERQAVQYKIR